MAEKRTNVEDKSLAPGPAEDKALTPAHVEDKAAVRPEPQAGDRIAVVMSHHHQEGDRHLKPGQRVTLPADRANTLVRSGRARLPDSK